MGGRTYIGTVDDIMAIKPRFLTLMGYHIFLTMVLCYDPNWENKINIQARDPYSFFIEVVSWASTSYDILARTNFGLPRQKCGNIDWMVDKITFNLSICDLFYTLVKNYEF